MNTIEKFSKVITMLDEVYKLASCTAPLDSDSTLVKQGANANELVIPRMTMDGLADYSRSSGYVNGDINFTHETVAFNYDRGRRFSVDNMDNEESAGLAFGKLSAEFIRTKTVPELDAFRFATYAAAEGITAKTGTLATGENVITALIAAQSEMDEAEVPSESRVLFITPTLYNAAMNVNTTISKAVLDSFAKIVKVPQTRFYTAIDMADGISDGEKAGGYTKAEDGKNINFMIVEKSAVIQYPKHTVNKIVTPAENQTNDSWMFFFRAYGLADTYENKRSGIYLHSV